MSDASSKEHSDEELGLAVNLWTSDRSGPFAQEIYDIIIDFVEQLEYGHPQLRRETLWACTLTCKRFVERSRKHLFHFLRLSPTTNVRRYEAVYCPSRLGLYVRSIRLEDAMAWAGNTDDGSPEESIDSIRNWLTPFIPLLSRLRNVDLSLSAIRWAQLGPDSRTFILNTFGPTAKSLTMISSHLFTTNQTLKVLRSFPRLSKLFLWGPLWEYPNHTSGQLSAQGPLDLDSLTLFDDLDGRGKYISWLSPIFQWLLADRPLFRVREAAIHTASTAAPLLLALLQRMLPSLEKLQLVLDICGQRRCNWVEEPTYYELDDDELSNGEEIVEAGGDFQYREQRRHQLEYECDHWISDEEAWLHYARTFKPTGDLQAPKLKFADISVTQHQTWNSSSKSILITGETT
ncbi:hypothetical protein OBBRIDRAFT_271986 [Obba rivulosa]|uniref:Uncharacterized protein n=1 Tax=Obba rivulosa TaxID=1052685 RepID=A0A8E2APW5_9APHY|nr:hypothetical protein OBBRIDRAFT_271986 [Obba rivulosa]